jgi:cytochrome bd-type quinol oxidase subunit 2
MNLNLEKNGVSKFTISFGLSLALASVVNGLLVIAKEKSPAIQSGMQKLTGHHWVTHSVIILGIFALFGWMFAQGNAGQGIKMTANRLISLFVSGVAMGGLIIVGFYLIGD